MKRSIFEWEALFHGRDVSPRLFNPADVERAMTPPIATPPPPPLDFFAVPKGRLCRHCGAGYLLRRSERRTSMACPNPGCNEHTLGSRLRTYRFRLVRDYVARSINLGPLVISPCPSSDTVWVWEQVPLGDRGERAREVSWAYGVWSRGAAGLRLPLLMY